MEDNATPELPEGTGLTEEGAVNALLERWNKAEEPATPEAETEPEPEPSTDTQESEEAPAEEEAAGDIEIDVGGTKFKAPKELTETFRQVEAKVKEIEAGATRKFQEAADLRKSAESQLVSVKQLQKVAEANADLIADHRMVARRLQQLESVDIANTDTETLSRLNAEYNQLQAANKRIESQYGQNVQAMNAENQRINAAKLEHSNKILATSIKGWGPEKAKSLVEYAISQGVPPEALNGINEAYFIKILDDAAYGRQMRDAKPQMTKRVEQTPKTLRAGAVGTQTPGTVAKADEAIARAKKTGSTQDAAMALLARSQVRKR